MLCSLCNSNTQHFWNCNDRSYVRCINCRAILLCAEDYLSPQQEKMRYLLHENDVNDPGYINFVSPVVEKIKVNHSYTDTGLDFGCGTGPVITSELEKAGFSLNLYDPYFKPNRKALGKKYDFIICCEVMEHFKDPRKEFALLRSLLENSGKLYCKTYLFNEDVDFKTWHYKDDATHLFFYTRKSLQFIKEELGYSSVDIQDQLIVFDA